MKDNRPSIIEDQSPSIAERFNRPYGRQRYCFEVPMSAQELRAKLAGDTRRFYRLSARKTFTGELTPQGFELMWGRGFRRNSLAPVAYGTITSLGNGCAVEIEFNFRKYTRISYIAMLLLIAWLASSLVLQHLSDGTDMGHGLLPVILVAALVILIPGNIFAISMGKKDVQKILNYFQEIPGSVEKTKSMLID